jgi:hypothetical protein
LNKIYVIVRLLSGFITLYRAVIKAPELPYKHMTYYFEQFLECKQLRRLLKKLVFLNFEFFNSIGRFFSVRLFVRESVFVGRYLKL